MSQDVEHSPAAPAATPAGNGGGDPAAEPVEHLVRPRDGGPRLAVREIPGRGRPFLLVHGLASNARLWDGVARHLAARGHRVVAVDLRGHGRSEAPGGGYDTDTAADDLAGLARALDLTGPVVAGQSWGGNVVLSLAARHPAVAAAVACVDGGWLRPAAAFGSFEECWEVLAPPVLDGVRFADVATRIRAAYGHWPAEGVDATLANLEELPGGGVRARLSREHHRDILRSLYEQDPAAWYPAIDVPVLLVPAVDEHGTGTGTGTDGDGGRGDAVRASVREALAALPDARVRWYAGADHDLHAQYPGRLAADLLELASALPDGAGRGATA